MKKAKKYIISVLIFIFLYTGSYCLLRLKKYFVRQEFVTFTCSEEIQQKYPSDTGSVVEGHVSYEFESYRNQIGCGRIQKREVRFAETFLRPVFYPISELEMRLRGFNSSTMRVLKYVAELERYTPDGKKVYFPRQSTVDEFTIDRKEQTL